MPPDFTLVLVFITSSCCRVVVTYEQMQETCQGLSGCFLVTRGLIGVDGSQLVGTGDPWLLPRRFRPPMWVAMGELIVESRGNRPLKNTKAHQRRWRQEVAEADGRGECPSTPAKVSSPQKAPTGGGWPERA